MLMEEHSEMAVSKVNRITLGFISAFGLQNYFLFFCNFTKIKIKSFENPKSKPATHCFIFNLSK
jgi:hypothetical protein